MTDTATPGLLRRAVRRLVTLTLTLTVFVGAAAGVFAGLSVLSNGPDATAGALAPPTTVGVMRVETAEGYAVTRRFTGQIEAAARTDLGFELGGRVTDVLVEEGDLVAAGALLARLDTSALVPERAALEAELAALAADAELARLTLAQRRAGRARASLHGGAGRHAAGAGAGRGGDGGDPGADRRRGRRDGEVGARGALRRPHRGAAGRSGADGGIGTDGRGAVRRGPRAASRGRSAGPRRGARPRRSRDGRDGRRGAGATVLQIRPDLDPSTRSRSVVLALPPDAAPVLGGTAELILEQRIAERGFWAPLSALREGVRGSWSVMALEATPEGDRTLPAAVEVIHADGARVFLRGSLPEGARIVAEAPDRVAPGQLVLAQIAALQE
jgi:membrane fusion protein, multidrug efflux system